MIYTVSHTVTKEFNNPQEAAKYYAELQKQSIKGIKTEFVPVKQDEFIEFLDNNPANETKQPKRLTKFQQELIWLADMEAEQRYEHEQNLFHL